MSEKGISFSANENQDSSGDLNSTFSPSERDFEKLIEPLEIENIQHFSVIPDFIDPTRSPYPPQRLIGALGRQAKGAIKHFLFFGGL